MNLHIHQLYLLEQHNESFKSWSPIIRINTEGKSSIMKLGPSLRVPLVISRVCKYIYCIPPVIQELILLHLSGERNISCKIPKKALLKYRTICKTS